MIFSGRASSRMVRGEVTVAFQPHKKRPRVLVKKHYPIQPRDRRNPKGRPHPSKGRFLVKSIDVVNRADISYDDIHAAGFSNRIDLESYLDKRYGADYGPFTDRSTFWRIEWEVIQVEDKAAA